MPQWAHNKVPPTTKRQYFDLIRPGHRGGAPAARRIGVSTSCGSLWFIDAGSVTVADPISPRLLTQDNLLAVADGLQARTSVKAIATGIRKSFQTAYR